MPARGYSQYRDEDELPIGDSSLDGLTDLPSLLRPTLETTESRTEHLLKNRRVQDYILKPKTTRAKVSCATFWTFLVSGTIVGCYFLIPLILKKVIVPLQVTIQTKWNPVAVAFLVIFGCALVPLVLLPAMPFIWLAAVSLGVWKGLLIVQVGTALGMAISYAVGKQFLRKRIRGWVEKKDWAQALFIAVKEAGPFKVILLMRLGPAPYAWLNYACSLSADIRFGSYILASIIGRTPHNLIDIYVGSGVNTAGEAASGEKIDPVLIAFYVVGFIFALCLSIGGYMYAKKALRDLKARALAREQVLTAFSFPELEEFDDLESPSMQRLPSSMLLPKKQEVEMSHESQNGLAGHPGSEDRLSRQSSEELLFATNGEFEDHSPKMKSLETSTQKQNTSRDSGTHLVADCTKTVSSDEASVDSQQ